MERVKDLTEGAASMSSMIPLGATRIRLARLLKPRGLWASFGNSSGPVDAFNIGILAQKGALYATRPTLFTYVATRPALEACANSLFDVVQSNKVRININQTYPLAEAGRAHTDLETRKTSGTTLADSLTEALRRRCLIGREGRRSLHVAAGSCRLIGYDQRNVQ